MRSRAWPAAASMRAQTWYCERADRLARGATRCRRSDGGQQRGHTAAGSLHSSRSQMSSLPVCVSRERQEPPCQPPSPADIRCCCLVRGSVRLHPRLPSTVSMVDMCWRLPSWPAQAAALTIRAEHGSLPGIGNGKREGALLLVTAKQDQLGSHAMANIR